MITIPLGQYPITGLSSSETSQRAPKQAEPRSSSEKIAELAKKLGGEIALIAEYWQLGNGAAIQMGAWNAGEDSYKAAVGHGRRVIWRRPSRLVRRL